LFIDIGIGIACQLFIVDCCWFVHWYQFIVGLLILVFGLSVVGWYWLFVQWYWLSVDCIVAVGCSLIIDWYCFFVHLLLVDWVIHCQIVGC
jgi:hypothetical protein